MIQLLLAIAAISTGAPLARWAAPAPAVAIGALRVGFAAVIQLAIGWRDLRALLRLTVRDRLLIALAGGLLAIHFATWIASLQMTSTAASVALVCTNPIFAAAFGLVLGDHVKRREVMGIAIAAVGCVVLAGGDWRAGGSALAGDGLALVGAASSAGYLVVGRALRTRAADLPLLPYLGTVNAIAAVALVVGAFVLRIDLLALPPHSYLACAGAALTASLIGHGLLNAAVRTTPTHLVALAILGEPIGASLITWAAFGEAPPVHAVAGGAIVLAGIAAGFAAKQR